MHEKIEQLRDRLKSLRESLDKAMPNDEPFTSQAGWTAPSISWSDLDSAVADVENVIELYGNDAEIREEDALDALISRVKFLEETTLPNVWGNPVAGVPIFLISVNTWRRNLERLLKSDPRHELTEDLKAIRRRLRAADAMLNSLEPSLPQVKSMVSDIRAAYEAADRLPTDLAALTEQNKQLEKISKESNQNFIKTQSNRDDCEEIKKEMLKISEEAQGVLDNCQTAYAAATSVGLAKAFSDRSRNLTISMIGWVLGLIVALTVAGFLGSMRLAALSKLLDSGQSPAGSVVLSAAMSALSIGAPIWFAWIATKQVGQQFRLAEDYAFKASISRAYEGYRREAARIDEKLEARLLATALDRLDEEPLRLVESATHSSPIHEALSADVVKQAFKQVPNFADQVRAMATKAVTGATTVFSIPKTQIAAISDNDEDEEKVG